MNLKIWLLATNCSGKTTFDRKNQGYYKGITLFDTDIYLRPINTITNLPLPKGWPETPLHRRPIPQDAIDFLRVRIEPKCCLMTSITNIGLTSYLNIEDIRVGVVLIRVEDLITNIKTRKIQDPGYGDNEANILDYRMKLQTHAEYYNLPIYNSFNEAIDDILEKNNG